MDIKPNEVEYVKVIGNLHGNEVKLVKTLGGLNIAIGKKNKNSNKTEALAAGSHAAIVAHQISKQFGADFHPAIFKSEQDAIEEAINKTELLPSSAISSGIELFTLEKNNKYDFVLYKHGLCLGEYKAEVEDNSLKLISYKFNIGPDQEIAKAMSRAIRDKAEELGLARIEKDWA